jgi:hypothetical protein
MAGYRSAVAEAGSVRGLVTHWSFNEFTKLELARSGIISLALDKYSHSHILARDMGELIQINQLHQARRRRSEKVSMEQCVELLEWNLKKSVSDYFISPREERSIRATQIRKLSEILEYAVRLL